MSVSILRPRADETNYAVVGASGPCPGSGAGSGPRGFICARVEAFDEKFIHKGTASQIIGRVYPGRLNLTSPSVPETPPDPTVDLCARAGVHEGNSIWFFSHLPGAQVGASEAEVNTLVVWVVFATSGPVTRAFHSFFGALAAQTECAISGSGSGVQPAPPSAGGGGTVALTMVPLLWTLLATGFSAGRAVFNGPWALNLRQRDNGHCVWDNDNDGVKVPRVELRCESPLVTTWRLSLRYGTTFVEYTRPAAEWNPLGTNALHRNGNGDGSGVADQLTVTPG